MKEADSDFICLNQILIKSDELNVRLIRTFQDDLLELRTWKFEELAIRTSSFVRRFKLKLVTVRISIKTY